MAPRRRCEHSYQATCPGKEARPFHRPAFSLEPPGAQLIKAAQQASPRVRSPLCPSPVLQQKLSRICPEIVPGLPLNFYPGEPKIPTAGIFKVETHSCRIRKTNDNKQGCGLADPVFQGYRTSSVFQPAETDPSRHSDTRRVCASLQAGPKPLEPVERSKPRRQVGSKVGHGCASGTWSPMGFGRTLHGESHLPLQAPHLLSSEGPPGDRSVPCPHRPAGKALGLLLPGPQGS